MSSELKNSKFTLKQFCIQLIIIVCVFFIFGEAYFEYIIRKDKIFRPEQLMDQSIKYVPAVFARYVFPQEERSIVNNYWIRDGEGTKMYFNEKGFRGKNFEVEKKEGEIRVMIYGGSAVFDTAMAEGNDWPTRVEQYLHEDGMINTHVINAGIPGLATFDSLGRYYAEGHHFNPDYVILYHGFNDILRFSSDKTLLREYKPYDPNWNQFLYYQNGMDQFLTVRSNIYFLFRHKRLMKKYPEIILGRAAMRENKEYALNENALKQFRLNLELFVDAVRDTGSEPVLMTQARLVHRENFEKNLKYLQNIEKYFPMKFCIDAFERADEIIRDVAKNKKVSLIDASIEIVEKDIPYFTDHVHFCNEGSIAMARKVTEFLKNKIQSK